jgi:hypothetical protein
MGWLEDVRARSQPLFRPALRVLELTIVGGAFLAALVALRGVPTEARLRLAFYSLVVGTTFDSILSLWLLVSRSARQRWVNPIHESRGIRRLLIGRSFSGVCFLVGLIVMKRFIGLP